MVKLPLGYSKEIGLKSGPLLTFIFLTQCFKNHLFF